MIIKRDRYLRQLIKKQWNGRIKVITGLRRCGKSFLLFELFKNYLLEQGINEDHIITIALDDDKNSIFRDSANLSCHIREIADKTDEKYYVFLDEIQYAISSAELRQKDEPVKLYSVLNGLLHLKNIDVYITGSNSKMLSNDISTEFRGRGDIINVYPLSFAEYIGATDLSPIDAYNDYSMFGGMPYLLVLDDDDEKFFYLKNLFDEIYFKDIVERYDINYPKILSELTDNLCSAIGSLTNATKIAKTLNSLKNTRISSETIAAYISHLSDSFLFKEALRFDIKGRKFFEYPSKFYCCDIGLRNVRLGLRQQEATHLMENIIFNELIIRGYSVDIGVIPLLYKNNDGKYHQTNCEIDFIATKGARKYYLQSAFSMDTPDKVAQEKRPLLAVNDNFQKIIITGNTAKQWQDEEGIIRMGVIEFLLDENSLSH